MDDLLASVASGCPQVVPYITAMTMAAAIVAMFLPPPPPGASQVWVLAYRVVNALALNYRHARNASEPATPVTPKV